MHIVLFKLKEGVSEDAIKQMDEAVTSMGKLDCVESINCGKNFTDRGRGRLVIELSARHEVTCEHTFIEANRNSIIFPIETNTYI